MPRAATWLLERFGSRSRFEPRIGDLVEQFEQGRSRLWYWRQAMGALAVAALLCVLAGVARAAGLDGDLTYTLHQQYMSDLLSIASVGYLILLLWHPKPASSMT